MINKAGFNTRLFWVSVLLLMLIVFQNSELMADDKDEHGHDAGSGTAESESVPFDSEDVYFSHVHGIGYSSDGKRIIAAAHDGLRVFTDGQWSKPDLPAHDYMGFAPIDDGFYSSGHPSLLTDLVNPLGLVKSTDDGRNLEILAFYGESDFHLLAAGYYSHVLYLKNEQPNSRMKAGVYYSLNEGRSWTKSRLRGLPKDVIQIATHPRKGEMVAMATAKGLFLSSDFGERFKSIHPQSAVSAVHFSPDGAYLIYGYRSLRTYSLVGEAGKRITIPNIKASDFVTFVAVNPRDTEDIVIVTKELNIFRSDNMGRRWIQILRDGRP